MQYEFYGLNIRTQCNILTYLPIFNFHWLIHPTWKWMSVLNTFLIHDISGTTIRSKKSMITFSLENYLVYKIIEYYYYTKTAFRCLWKSVFDDIWCINKFFPGHLSTRSFSISFKKIIWRSEQNFIFIEILAWPKHCFINYD